MVKIAVVDDNETWCFVLANAFQQQGFAVETFTNPHAFLAQAGEFDLALIDYSMPTPRYQKELEGPEVLAHLKKHLTNPPILVLLSSYFTDDTLGTLQPLFADADACLSKRISLVDLVDQVKQLVAIDRTPDQPETRSDNDISPAPKHHSDSMDKLPAKNFAKKPLCSAGNLHHTG
jgi:CheY-like chemotaxis protein